MIRIDFNLGRCDMLVSDEDIERRKADGIPAVPADATPWQRHLPQVRHSAFRRRVLEGAADFRQIAKNHAPPQSLEPSRKSSVIPRTVRGF